MIAVATKLRSPSNFISMISKIRDIRPFLSTCLIRYGEPSVHSLLLAPIPASNLYSTERSLGCFNFAPKSRTVWPRSVNKNVDSVEDASSLMTKTGIATFSGNQSCVTLEVSLAFLSSYIYVCSYTRHIGRQPGFDKCGVCGTEFWSCTIIHRIAYVHKPTVLR